MFATRPGLFPWRCEVNKAGSDNSRRIIMHSLEENCCVFQPRGNMMKGRAKLDSSHKTKEMEAVVKLG
jgi:hypothetical protein